MNGDFDTVSVDLPGFGNSPPLPEGDTPTPHRLADYLETVLDELGWSTAHLVGNSLGAWVSLELARRGRASSVCALMPAGLWRSTGGVGHQRRKALFAMWTNGTRLPMAGSLIRNAAVRSSGCSGCSAVRGAFPQPTPSVMRRICAPVISLGPCLLSTAPDSRAAHRYRSLSRCCSVVGIH
ncbi:alpha/beta fold hydrolase [Rhodococcus sp. IEGM 1381]|uniref:alpha/beta hydrolase n=1 Tax=Rhodococcus sp. IEGM 1381 TaxID=3047085 RepID=UPI0024B6AED3|nr:alpha/beta fold hydrolase [Rhodococcus sp. IEGM 1381]MDI9894502.1 alpha/beta fold hydrolase [Rhodococcus sp. IEGM 1381]